MKSLRKDRVAGDGIVSLQSNNDGTAVKVAIGDRQLEMSEDEFLTLFEIMSFMVDSGTVHDIPSYF